MTLKVDYNCFWHENAKISKILLYILDVIMGVITL